MMPEKGHCGVDEKCKGSKSTLRCLDTCLQAIVVQEDKEEALKWFKRAADRGHQDACNAVAVHALEEKNYKDAKRYLQMAARQGHERAMFNLGDLYYHGHGMAEPSLAKAIEMYKMGHRAKHMQSTQKLVELGVDLDEPLKRRLGLRVRVRVSVRVRVEG